jgi:N-methylhydantoinase A
MSGTDLRPVPDGSNERRLRLGIDIGGTFTDLVIMDEETGAITIEKVPSTPSDPSIGFETIVVQGLRAAGSDPRAVCALAHGTTVATNCIIEGKTAACGLLTTEGFRDILEIARQIKPEPFNLFFDKPRPLVPRHRCREARERLDAEGSVLQELVPETVRAAARSFAVEKVEAVAICFLHSYVNPSHEQLAAEILRSELPGVHLSLSSEVCPEFREYFRASTTVVNAVIAPIVSTYLSRVEVKLADLGVNVPLCIMQSNGGIYTAEVARKKPVHIVESGPAAGVIVAAHIGALCGRRDVISLDIGGTTAKAGLIQNGAPKISNEFEVGAQAAGRRLNAKATGYPIKSGVVDLVEIGAGGGSVGWVDSGGALRVGPHSAGAQPGPACYGWGGESPTLTDANLVLGRINADFFLGGKMKLLREAAVRAMEGQIASRGTAPRLRDRARAEDPRGLHPPESGGELGLRAIAGRYQAPFRSNLHQGPGPGRP